MRVRLMLLFTLIILAMILLTTRASLGENVVAAFGRLARDPWGLATLADAYFAFFTFWLWLAWKEGPGWARIAWLGAILLLGNLAMATYVLIELVRTPSLDALVTRRKE